MFWFFWFLFSVAVGILASNRGRSGFGWFLLAALISPLIAFIFVLATKDLSVSARDAAASNAAPSSATHVRCPACAEWVLPEATVCKHCGGPLKPDEDFYILRAREADQKKKDDSQNLAVGASAVFALILIAVAASKCSG